MGLGNIQNQRDCRLTQTETHLGCDFKTADKYEAFLEVNRLAVPIKSTFVHFSVDQTVQEHRARSCPPKLASPKASKESGEVFDGGVARNGKVVLNLSDGLETLSVGSMKHARGCCQPCAFFHTNQRGCVNGRDCAFCHLCTPDELRRWKKWKRMVANQGKGPSQRPQARPKAMSE